MMKVVLDTNTYISGILFNGAPRKVLNLIIEGKVESFISDEIVTELREVLGREKFGLSGDNVHFIVAEIESVNNVVYPAIPIQAVEKDTTDNKVIECAVEADADVIISGDKHLTELKRFRNIEIAYAGDFLYKYFK